MLNLEIGTVRATYSFFVPLMLTQIRRAEKLSVGQ